METQPNAKDTSEEACLLTSALVEQVESRVVEWLMTQLAKATLEEVSQAGDVSTQMRKGKLVHYSC